MKIATILGQVDLGRLTLPECQPECVWTRENAIVTIKETNLSIEEVPGEDMTMDSVMDLVNQANSGGTKLSLKRPDTGQELCRVARPPLASEPHARMRPYQSKYRCFCGRLGMRCRFP
jgi:hypothetical protein